MKLLASMSLLRYSSRMLVSTATELSNTPLTSWPLKNCCRASFSPKTWDDSRGGVGSMFPRWRLCCWGTRCDQEAPLLELLQG